MDDSDSNTFQGDVLSLTHMMDLEPGGPELWKPEDLGAILEHQLSAPLHCDLAPIDEGLAGQLESAGGTPIRSFADLLHHPHPPIEMLQATKRFAKACRSRDDGPLPDEVATVLYILSIVAAMLHGGRRITKMDDASLRYSLDWALKQPWLDDASRGLIEQGRQAITPH